MFDIYTSKLAEARQFRDLGYYSRTSVCFEESDYEHSVLAIESSGFLFSKGFMERGHNKISQALTSGMEKKLER
jgi:hypothetical protein